MTDKIAEIESFAVSIPLDKEVSFATRSVEERDHTIVYVRTEDGTEGVGYTLGYGGADVISQAVVNILTPIVMGEDPLDTSRLWREMFDETVQIGRKGVLIRAISCIDIALWDIKAKKAGMPLYKLLGGHTDEVPAYASGGYYRDEKGLDGLREEMETYVQRGHDVVKMKTGRKTIEEEVERVKAVRETIGPNRTLLLDANGKWRNKQEAVRACRRFAEYDPYFIEEPVMPDSLDLYREVNKALDYAVAGGELEFTRYGFTNLIRENAVEIIQPDATVVGGITEWMRIANFAGCYDIPIASHYNWDLHIQLHAAIENDLWIEYFHRDFDVKAFDDIIEYPIEPEDGTIKLPERTGHGVELDRDELDKYII
jgi:D-arabinonate dehydratase